MRWGLLIVAVVLCGCAPTGHRHLPPVTARPRTTVPILSTRVPDRLWKYSDFKVFLYNYEKPLADAERDMREALSVRAWSEGYSGEFTKLAPEAGLSKVTVNVEAGWVLGTSPSGKPDTSPSHSIISITEYENPK